MKGSKLRYAARADYWVLLLAQLQVEDTQASVTVYFIATC